MAIIFMLLAISISLALFFLVSFIWASRDGQFDDTYAPAQRILFDDHDQIASDPTKKDKECN